MRMRPAVIFALIVSACLVIVGIASSQQESPEIRKVVRRVYPAYPEMAKRWSLSGTVKLQATVSPDGSVKSVQAMGGSPVLIPAAQEAVTKWKFAPAKEETKENVEIKFDPQQ